MDRNTGEVKFPFICWINYTLIQKQAVFRLLSLFMQNVFLTDIFIIF